MVQKKAPQKSASKTSKRTRPVAVDQQNPASTNVAALVESLAKRKERKKAKR